jgi:pimeloyl-ACP methyl ester carboxylesterase
MKHFKVLTIFFTLIFINMGTVVWSAALAFENDFHISALAAAAAYYKPDDPAGRKYYAALSDRGYTCIDCVPNPHPNRRNPMQNSVSVFEYKEDPSILLVSYAGTNLACPKDVPTNRELALEHIATIGRSYERDAVFAHLGRVGGRVHRGYAQRFHALERLTCAAHPEDGFIRRLLSRSPRGLTFIGHSMGGGLASLAALYAANLGLTDHRVVTFGAPPVFDDRLAQHLNRTLPERSYLRVVNPLDPFAHSSTAYGNIWGNPAYVHAGLAYLTSTENPDISRTLTAIRIVLGVEKFEDLGRSSLVSERPEPRTSSLRYWERPARPQLVNIWSVLGMVALIGLPVLGHSMDISYIPHFVPEGSRS